jgi:hypothetical protein
MYLNPTQSTGEQTNSSIVQHEHTQYQYQNQQHYFNTNSNLSKQTKNNSNNNSSHYQPYEFYATNQIINENSSNDKFLNNQSETDDMMIHIKQIDDQQKHHSNNSTFIDHIINPNNINHQLQTHQSINLYLLRFYLLLFFRI